MDLGCVTIGTRESRQILEKRLTIQPSTTPSWLSLGLRDTCVAGVMIRGLACAVCLFGATKPRNLRHLDTIEGGRNMVGDSV